MAKALRPIPAIIAPSQPSRLRQVTMTPAIKTPIKIDKKAYLKFKPKRTAASEPVQAPVIGRGMATNSARPIRSYFSIIFPRRLVRSKSQFRNLSRRAILPNHLVMASRNSRIKGTGSRLPMIASSRA